MSNPNPLFIDFAEHGPQPHLAAVSADPRYSGAIIKASEGLHYNSAEWFSGRWPAIASQKRYSDTWFRGCYHSLIFHDDGAAQADFYMNTVESAGGWRDGDFWPIVSVELDRKRNLRERTSAEQVIDCTSTFAERIASVTGREVMLYGNGAMRDLQIRDRMGCEWLWCPRHMPTMPNYIVERAGWPVERLVMWQYAGVDPGMLPHFPSATPDGRKVNHSALVLAGGVERLRKLLHGQVSIKAAS